MRMSPAAADPSTRGSALNSMMRHLYASLRATPSVCSSRSWMIPVGAGPHRECPARRRDVGDQADHAEAGASSFAQGVLCRRSGETSQWHTMGRGGRSPIGNWQ